MTLIKPPTKFVGLHAHSLSVGDSIGLPKEHIDFAIENGMDALALTDHGHMNSYSHQYIYWQELQKKGVKFKAIPGAEMYFVNSLKDWQKLYDDDKAQKLQARFDKSKTKKSNVESLEDLSDELADTKEELDEATAGGTVVENEEESKKTSWRNPLSKRSHLVLLPKNQEGLYSLFNLISLSYADGFYRFPRIDFDLLKKHANGNMIASSACVAGSLASIIFDHQTDPEWDNWVPTNENFEIIQEKLAAQIHNFQDALGGAENFYLELQFNKLNCLSGDSIIETDSGQKSLRTLVDEVQLGASIHVKSFSEDAIKPEYKKVLWGKLMRKNAKVVKIRLKNGKTLKLTSDHRVYTNKGWMQAGKLSDHKGIKILSIS